MEHISNQLQRMQTEKAPEQNNSLTTYVPKSHLTEAENRMVCLKYKSKQIAAMDSGETGRWSKALLLKIHVITGWVIPGNELMNILVDQFEKKLIETYGSLNPDEIEYAFRTTGTTVEDWGKSMNLNLLDKVLLPYLQNRIALSEVEEKQATKPESKIYTDEELLNQKREETQYCYRRFLKGDLNYFPTSIMYEVLLHDELIEEGEDVREFFENLAAREIQNIYTKD